MNTIDVLAALPQFLPAESPRSVYNVLSNFLVTERAEAEGVVLQSGATILGLEGRALEKFVLAMQLQAEQLKAYRGE
jgi:hypothetical protein